MVSLVGKTGGVTGVEYKQRKLASPETGMVAQWAKQGSHCSYMTF